MVKYPYEELIFLFNVRKLLNKSFLLYISLQADYRAFHYLKNKILSSQLLWFAFLNEFKRKILQKSNTFLIRNFIFVTKINHPTEKNHKKGKCNE